MTDKEHLSKDYVFTKDDEGSLKFVGNFEGYYQDHDDPWGQSGDEDQMSPYYALSRERLIRGLNETSAGSILELGCGLGYVTNLIAKACRPRAVEGMDISPTAIDKASSIFPDYVFHVGDVSAADFIAPKQYGAVILNQMLWYVLDDLARVFANSAAMMGAGGRLYISNAFLRDQKYGKEIVDGFDGLLNFILLNCASEWQILEARYEDSGSYSHNDGLVILRRR